MVAAPDLKSVDFGRPGSSPGGDTNLERLNMRYIVQAEGPTVGMTLHEAVECEPDEIESYAFQIAVDNLESFGYEFNPDGEDDYETTCSEVDYSYEVYDAEKHDGHRMGGGSFEIDFERMK